MVLSLLLRDAVAVCDCHCRGLELRVNQLSGAIPETLGSLTGLT